MVFDGSLLSYGLPGLALGLVGGIVTAILAVKVTEQQHETLKTCFKYATIFMIVCAVISAMGLALNYLGDSRSSRMTVSVQVSPDIHAIFPDAIPVITSELTKVSDGKLVEVSTQGVDSNVYVDVGKLREHLLNLRTSNDKLQSANQQLTAQVQQSNAVNGGRAKLFAATMPTSDATKAIVDQVLKSAQPEQVADTVCKKDNAAQCGWAQLARGDINAASASFTQATEDKSLPKDQVASAINGLGYTKLTQGKVAEAAQLTQKAADAGDVGASKQLPAIRSAAAEAGSPPGHR